MPHSLSIQDLFDLHAGPLKFKWVTGEAFSLKQLHPTPEDLSCMVGFLNFVHPPQITLLGEQEFHYLAGLDPQGYDAAIKQFFNASPSLIIICDGHQPTNELLALSQERQLCMLSTEVCASTVHQRLSHQLSEMLAPNITIHGVFMEVFDLGVLLTGESGVGKSELALELINRGHRLIADDSPVFYRSTPDTLTGFSPPLLKDFLEVRGLGIINVRAMFGNTAVKENKKLSLIVHVVNMTDPIVKQIDRLEGMHKKKTFLDVEIPEVTLPAGPGRSLSVLVEAAVHNQVLRKNGYHAESIFIEQQTLSMSKEA